MAKGLDGKFLHYGIRREDLELIQKDKSDASYLMLFIVAS